MQRTHWTSFEKTDADGTQKKAALVIGLQPEAGCHCRLNHHRLEDVWLMLSRWLFMLGLSVFCRSCRAGVTVVLKESMPKVVESSGSGSSHRVKSGFTRTAAGKKE